MFLVVLELGNNKQFSLGAPRDDEFCNETQSDTAVHSNFRNFYVFLEFNNILGMFLIQSNVSVKRVTVFKDKKRSLSRYFDFQDCLEPSSGT